MDSGQDSKIGKLVDFLMSRVSQAAAGEDWKESEGWIGKWNIIGEQEISRIYEIRGGKFHPGSPQETYTGQVEMSEDTFLDLMAGAFNGQGEAVFVEKYAKHAIRYRGDQWIVDSERFRKILKTLGKKPIGRLV